MRNVAVLNIDFSWPSGNSNLLIPYIPIAYMATAPEVLCEVSEILFKNRQNDSHRDQVLLLVHAEQREYRSAQTTRGPCSEKPPVAISYFARPRERGPQEPNGDEPHAPDRPVRIASLSARQYFGERVVTHTRAHSPPCSAAQS